MTPQTRLNIPFGRPLIGEGERVAVLEALSSPQLVHGPRAQQFEQEFSEFLGPEASSTSVSSCTAGLHLIYMHLGIGPGDEVIVPAQTHVATAHAVEITGARPVFVDCDSSGNMDPSRVAEKVSHKTKAICVVHYPGLPVDMPSIEEVVRPQGIFIVEDCALAIGASYAGTACGLIGDASSFSFYPAKHMTTGEGGMVVSKHPEVVASIANLKAFGYDRTPQDRSVPGVYDIARLGLNYRMNELSAAIGLVQLQQLPTFLERRRTNARTLRELLADEPKLALLPGGDGVRIHANYCVVGVLTPEMAPRRDELLMRLRDIGVGLSVHYPVPLPLSTYYREQYKYEETEFPEAARISSSSIAIPVGPHLDASDVASLASAIKSVIKDLS